LFGNPSNLFFVNQMLPKPINHHAPTVDVEVQSKETPIWEIKNEERVEEFKEERGANESMDLRSDIKRLMAFKHVLKSGLLQPLSIIYLLRVSKGMKKNVLEYLKQCQHFDFSFFFAVIGNFTNNGQDNFLKFCQNFKSLKSVEFKYCANLKASLLDRIIEHLEPDVENPQIQHLNLFFSSACSDAVCAKIVRRLPELRELNLGRCHRITEKSRHGVQQLGSLKKLERLVLTIDPWISKDLCWQIQAILSQKDNFPSLKELDIQGSISWDKYSIDIDDLKDRFEEVIGPKYVEDKTEQNQELLYFRKHR